MVSHGGHLEGTIFGQNTKIFGVQLGTFFDSKNYKLALPPYLQYSTYEVVCHR